MKDAGGEIMRCYQAVIAAAAAAIAFTAVIKGRQRFGIYQCRPFLTAVMGQQSRAKSTHQPCNIRPDHFFAGQLFHRAQNSVAVEGAALYDDSIAQFASIAQTNDFIKRVFDDRNSQSGSNIADCRAVLLRLLYFGVHKYRTAHAQINRLLRC